MEATTALRGFFVTGTGTEVGKTFVAAAIARTLRVRGQSVAVFKPAVSGLDSHERPRSGEASGEPVRLPPDHELLRLAAGSSQSDDEIAPYRYGPPVSPHLAAELAGEAISPERLRTAARDAAAPDRTLVCEGVGGFLVPLTPGYLIRDLALDLGLPVVVAASPGLGTINHTLLTLEAVRAAGLEARAVVLTPWPREPGGLERSNRETIAALGGVRVEGLPCVDPGEMSAWPALEL